MPGRHRRRRRKYGARGAVAGTVLAATLAYTAAADEEPAEVTTSEIPVVRPFDDEYQAEVSEARRDAATLARSLPARPAPLPEPEVELAAAQPLHQNRFAVIEFARAQVGEPYEWAAEGPGAWDCSGLVQQAFASVGIRMPRVSDDQNAMGTRVPVSDLNPGDLVGWDGHVAIYAGNGTIIEAPRPGLQVRERFLADDWWDSAGFGVRLDYSTLPRS